MKPSVPAGSRTQRQGWWGPGHPKKGQPAPLQESPAGRSSEAPPGHGEGHPCLSSGTETQELGGQERLRGGDRRVGEVGPLFSEGSWHLPAGWRE